MLFKTTYRSPRKFVYVQIVRAGQELQVRYTVVAKEQKEIAWTEVSDVAELVKKAGKSLPYVLHFREFGVLTRITENIPAFKDSLLVNGNEEDFYFNSMTIGGTVGVSFLRKSLAAEIVEELRAAKAFVWAIHAGPVLLLVLTEGKEAEFRYDFSVTVSKSGLQKLERNQESVKQLPGMFLSEDEAYVKAMRTIMDTPPEGYSDGLPEEEVAKVRSDYKEFMRFVKLGVGMLSLFFLALVGNYFYVNALNSQAAQLEADITGYGEDLALIDRLEQEKSRKTLLVDNSGLQSQRYLTFYLDELGASVPATIQLETLEAFPLVEALKPKRKVELDREHISIAGFSSDSKVLDDWMERLEEKKWVQGVELMSYVRINDKKAVFNLLVSIKK